MKKLYFFLLFGFLVFIFLGQKTGANYYHAQWGLNTSQIWGNVGMLTNVRSDDPLFSTNNQRLYLIRDATSYVGGHSLGYACGTEERVVLAVNQRVANMPLPDYYVPSRIVGVKREYSGGVTRFLTGMSISDFEKVGEVSSSYPEYYSFWNSKIFFSPAPTVACSMMVYFNFNQNTNLMIYGTTTYAYSSISPPYWHILILKTIALMKEKEGNQAAAQNINQICDAMLLDLNQIRQMAENYRDLIIMPSLYEE